MRNRFTDAYKIGVKIDFKPDNSDHINFVIIYNNNNKKKFTTSLPHEI